jgi:predicted membrane-bound spermidine synthase
VKDVEHAGSATGTLNAIGTTGSIVGAVATGAFLLPYFGVSSILLGIAVTLLFAGFLFLRRNPTVHALILGVVLVLAFFLNALPTRASVSEADISTSYNRVFIDHIAAFDNARTISTDPFGLQCAMRLHEDGTVDENSIVFPYVKAFEIVRAHIYPIGNARTLFLGGCNFSYPRYVLNLFPDMIADVVEIDPGMTAIAERYFGFTASQFPTLSITHTDARLFLQQPHEAYDLIVMDTFGSSKGIPVHLTTQEMFESVSKNMSASSYLIINAHGAYIGEGSELPSALFKTVQSVFPHVAVYEMTGVPDTRQNLIMVASFSSQTPKLLLDSRFPEIILTQITLPESDIILTDDFAPVERLMH